MKYQSRICMQLLLVLCLSTEVYAWESNTAASRPSDREYWADLLYKIAAPVFSNMSKGELQKNMPMEVSPRWDNRNIKLAYFEAFGRLMAGVAPWLALPDDNTPEGVQRKQIREWALASCKHAVDPDSPDYLPWGMGEQALVDAAFLANGFIRAPKALWEPLDGVTKQRYIKEFQKSRQQMPAYTNHLQFRTMIEAFFVMIGEQYDGFALKVCLRKLDEWYIGDGWYLDGPEFAMDYYNSYVIQPMLVETIDILQQKKLHSPISLDLALRRMDRFNRLLERLISPEATFPVMGRSITYRMGAFQTLALAAWKYELPKSLPAGQVRNSLTSVMKRMFSMEGTFNDAGYLRIGFAGHQPELGDFYINTGSLYLTTFGFLPLGLPANHPFWTDEPLPWTSKKAWEGQVTPNDYRESIKR